MCEVPAKNGVIARATPTKRPRMMALPPCALKIASTRATMFGVMRKRGPWRIRKSRPSQWPSQ